MVVDLNYIYIGHLKVLECRDCLDFSWAFELITLNPMGNLHLSYDMFNKTDNLNEYPPYLLAVDTYGGLL